MTSANHRLSLACSLALARLPLLEECVQLVLIYRDDRSNVLRSGSPGSLRIVGLDSNTESVWFLSNISRQMFQLRLKAAVFTCILQPPMFMRKHSPSAEEKKEEESESFGEQKLVLHTACIV